LPNDGTGGFGPDTTLGATSVGEIGSPYTQTVGIQEAGDYAFSRYQTVSNPSGIVVIPKISILNGSYSITTPIIWNPSNLIPSGYGINDLKLDFDPNAMLYYDGTGYLITIDGNASTTDMGLYINYIDGFIGSSATGLIQWDFATTSGSAYVIMNNPNNSVSSSTQYFCYFRGQLSVSIKNNVAGGIIHANCKQFIIIDTPFFEFGNAGLYQLSAPFQYVRGITNLTGVTSPMEKPEIAVYEMINGTISTAARQTTIRGGTSVTLTFPASDVVVINTLNLENIRGPSSGTLLSAVSSGGTQNIGTLRARNVLAGYSGATFIDTTDLSVSNYDIKGTYDLIHGYAFSSVPVNTPTISTNPPVSGTVYQNTNPYAIEIDLPVYATTSGTAGYVTIAKGVTSTPTAIGNQYVSGDTSSTATQIIRVRVPAGWYYSFTGSGVTFSTATPFAE
jgi:hypothetical protein